MDDQTRAAIQKRQRGESLSRDEQRRVDRFLKERRETEQRELLRAVPKKLYREMAGGRQHKQLDDHARAYGAPLSGATIDLFEVVAWLHDFLVERREDLATRDGKGGTLKDQHIREQIEGQRLANARRELQLATERGELAPVAELREGLENAANLLAELGERFRRAETLTGPQAAEQLLLTIEDFRASLGVLPEPEDDEEATDAQA